MRILAIDSSARTAACAVTQDGTVLCSRFANNGLTHSQTLLPLILSMLEEEQMNPNTLDCVAVTTGPGSFTGLRIGVATAKALAMAWQISACSVSTLEALAFGAGAPQDAVVCSVMDARCGNVYNAFFRVTPKGLERLCPDRAISVAELKKESILQKNSVFLVGDGAEICYNENDDADWQMADSSRCQLHGESVALLARLCEKCLPAELRIQYIQLPQAQRSLLAGQLKPKGKGGKL